MQTSIVLLQDRLTGALVGLANAAMSHEPQLSRETAVLVAEALCASANCFDENALRALTERVHAEKALVSPDCAACKSPCGRTNDYDMRLLWTSDEDIRTLKTLMLNSLRGIAACMLHAARQGRCDAELDAYLLKALRALGDEWDAPRLMPQVLEAGAMYMSSRALLNG